MLNIKRAFVKAVGWVAFSLESKQCFCIPVYLKNWESWLSKAV